MSGELDVIRGRIDEHGRILDEHGEAIEGLTLVVLGDDKRQIKGLLQRTTDLEKLTKEVKDWRRDMETAWRVGIIYARVMVALLGVLGLAAWKDALAGLLKIIAGG